jgi:hypothetical protein
VHTSEEQTTNSSTSPGALSFLHSSHTPPYLFPTILGNSFKRPRTTSPPTSIEENGSETDTEVFNIATPSSEPESLPERKGIERGHSPVSSTNLTNPLLHGHLQHQQTPLRFSFGSANTIRDDMSTSSDKNKEAIDGLLTTNMLNITDGETPSSMMSDLPSYQQAVGQSIEVSTPPVNADVTSNVMPSIIRPDGKEQLAKVTALNEQPLQEGQSWFLVDQAWFELWKTNCEKEGKGEDGDDLAVGRITTQNLLTKQLGTISLRRGLEEGIHFQLLTRESWEQLETW